MRYSAASAGLFSKVKEDLKKYCNKTCYSSFKRNEVSDSVSLSQYISQIASASAFPEVEVFEIREQTGGKKDSFQLSNKSTPAEEDHVPKRIRFVDVGKLIEDIESHDINSLSPDEILFKLQSAVTIIRE